MASQMDKLITLDEFCWQKQRELPFATSGLSGLLRDLGLATKMISTEVNRAGLTSIIGATGQKNASGEAVQKLDRLADELLISCLKNSGECCGIASEEQDSFVVISSNQDAKYVVLFDPLDGSSNIDVNASIGTIFAIYRRVSQQGCRLRDFLQNGLKQVAAGYVLYGASTLLVYATENGVNGFTLEQSIGEFCLSLPDIRIPQKGKLYAVNASQYPNFEEGIQNFISECIELKCNFRYIGSMVADVHRTLIQGGIFMYPATTERPKGKLRLLYECNPLAFVIEQAGGVATNGQRRILELEAVELHQLTPIYMGSPNLVARLGEHLARKKC